MTTVNTPISEEIVKAAPVFFYALVFSDEREKLMTIAFSVGIGFAMFENMVILIQNIENVSVG